MLGRLRKAQVRAKKETTGPQVAAYGAVWAAQWALSLRHPCAEIQVRDE